MRLLLSGAFSAAAAAVWVATTDRRERKDERDAADAAQAALVIAQPFAVAAGYPGLGVAVQNYGMLSILQVTSVRLDVEGHPQLDLRRTPGVLRRFRSSAPWRDDKGGTYFTFRPGDDEQPFKRALEGNTDFTGNAYDEGVSDIAENAASRAPTITNKTLLTATVWFQDAKGNRWETFFSAPAVVRLEGNNQIDSSTHHVFLRRL